LVDLPVVLRRLNEHRNSIAKHGLRIPIVTTSM
jgi:hypothetical protein